METEFTTELRIEIHGEYVTAEITYSATPSQSEGRYYTSKGHEIEITNVKYSQFGCEINAEGKLWQQLERAAQEAAEDHFAEAA